MSQLLFSRCGMPLIPTSSDRPRPSIPERFRSTMHLNMNYEEHFTHYCGADGAGKRGGCVLLTKWNSFQALNKGVKRL